MVTKIKIGLIFVSTHSRPKAAGRYQQKFIVQELVSTHSRPKAAGIPLFRKCNRLNGFNTQPPEGGWFAVACYTLDDEAFQHTAARRRLERVDRKQKSDRQFQHTAARRRLESQTLSTAVGREFQHTAARRRLEVKS